MIEQMYVTTEGKRFKDKLTAEVTEKAAFRSYLDHPRTVDLRWLLNNSAKTSVNAAKYELTLEIIQDIYKKEKGWNA